MRYLFLPLIASAVFANGCATKPAPVAELPQTLLDRSTAEPVAPRPIKLDPDAEAFVQRALQRSPDVAVVEARWREATALARAADGTRLPRVEASAETSRGRSRLRLAGEQESLNEPARTQQVGFDFRWELDLFGRLSSARTAAAQERNAAKADLDAAKVTLANMLRSEIVRLRVAGSIVAVSEAMQRDLRETVAIVSTARAAGLSSEVDLGQMRSTIAAREADLITLRSEVSSARLRLRTLSDLPLREVDALQGDSGRCAVAPPIDQVPLRWLRERRDVAAAEARLLAGAAAAQSAQAALYPSIGLTGSLSRQREVGTLLGAIVTESLQRSLALGLVGTVFDGGQRSAEARSADARKAAALAEFQWTLLQAAEEVDGSIDRIQILSAAQEAADRASNESAQALERIQRRHEAGIDSRLAVLQARREAAERQLLAFGFGRDHCIASLDLNRALALREAP